MSAFDPLPYLAPVFALALVAEGLAVRYSRRALVSGIGCIVVDQVAAAWGLALFLSAFAALHRHVAVITLPTASITTWLIATLAHDLAYYAFHRASHRVNILWAAHVVHHQSERYDFTVSLRQGSIATWVSYLFYAPLALLINAQVFLIVHAAYQVFQFFVHTRAIGTLGPLEWLFATPSHHRVHHGSERRHIDRNYGGFFIVFDRLFNTFTVEDREPRYGVPGGYEMTSPLFANSYMFLRLIAASSRRTWRERLSLWLGPPEAAAKLISSGAHPPRVVETTTLMRTWLPLAAAVGCALAVGFAGLPMPLDVTLAIASIVLVELASAPLDGRR
jgi:sterol desaturase/sphingolipid hydroxylase (fatty acid hydroxylase superfamily)